MKENKRGQGLSLNVIIVAAIGLFVLIILAIIFRQHIGSYVKGYKETADEAIGAAKGERCKSFLSDTTRKCSDVNPEVGKWRKVISGGGWEDCDENKNEECWEYIN